MWLIYPAGLVGLYFLHETLYPSVFSKALQFICAVYSRVSEFGKGSVIFQTSPCSLCSLPTYVGICYSKRIYM